MTSERQDHDVYPSIPDKSKYHKSPIPIVDCGHHIQNISTKKHLIEQQNINKRSESEKLKTFRSEWHMTWLIAIIITFKWTFTYGIFIRRS